MCPHAQIGRESAFGSYKIRCVLIHDHVLLRQGLRRLLEDEPDLEVVAEAGDAAEGLLRVAEVRPEIVIADARVFGCAAEQAEQLVLQASAQSKVLFLSANPMRGEIPDGVSDGTSWVVERTSAEELAEMVRLACRGSGMLMREMPRRAGDSPRKGGLTAREHEVLKLLAEGRTVRSAAVVLGLSMKTVDAHKFNLMRKLGVHNKAELVLWAIRQRVVKLPVNY
ncbi:MAG TPA: response regulator transcription factor [Terriglobales bacterium]|nr:response regulator transcription factor [Terriglobales bacterium]